jgi:hypothetical protein
MYKSKDEQFSTWMDWIWSSMCLELLCTSTQSNNLKWVSGGGINSPRHQTSRWLTATEKASVGWTDARFSRASVHPVPLPCHLAVEILWHNYSDAIHRRSIGSSGAEDPATKSSLLASTRPSDRPTLPLDQGVGISTLRPSDHPVLLSSLLFLCNSSDATRKCTIDSSDGA